MTSVPARDGCVVDSGPLAGLLSGFVDDWNRTRSADAGRFSKSLTKRTEVSKVRALAYLSDETGVPEGTIEKLLHRDRRTGELAPRTRTTELRIADPIVAAIGCIHAFHDGTLDIKPNPQASPADRASCCGGSLTGGLAA